MWMTIKRVLDSAAVRSKSSSPDSPNYTSSSAGNLSCWIRSSWIERFGPPLKIKSQCRPYLDSILEPVKLVGVLRNSQTALAVCIERVFLGFVVAVLLLVPGSQSVLEGTLRPTIHHESMRS